MNAPRLLAAKVRSAAEELVHERGVLSVAVSAGGVMTAVAALYAGLLLKLSAFLGPGLMPLSIAGSFVAVVLALLGGIAVWWRPRQASWLLAAAVTLLGISLVVSGAALVDWALSDDKNPVAILGPIGVAFAFGVATLGLALIVAQADDVGRQSAEQAR